MRRTRFLVAVGLACVGTLGSLLILELFVRLTWDPRQGVPGLVLGHPTRAEVLAPDYRGYFAGQPLRINHLGFRDDREYDVRKGPGVFRILVLGDSVTFGHGCRFAETWPYLLEQRLRRWNPSVNWQVWNLGVPGYDTVLELRTLDELGPVYHPDLVIVGFFENDIEGWDYLAAKPMPRWAYTAKWFLKRHFYLYTKLRYVYNQLRFLNRGGRTEAEYEQRLLAKPAVPIPPYALERFDLTHRHPGAPTPPPARQPYVPDKSGFRWCQAAVDQLKRYHREGRYDIVFFINIAPDVSADGATFVDGIHNDMNEFFLHLLGDPTPVVSSYEAFWSYRPSEVPEAGGHSKGPANVVKADVLCEFLTTHVGAIQHAARSGKGR